MMFLNQLNKELNNETDSTDEIICLGEFNTVLNNSLDVISGKPHNAETVSHFKAWVRQLNLYDIWRLRNQEEKQFTWTRSNIARRLDYIFLGESIYNSASDAEIKSYAFSDHSPVTCTLSFEPRQRISGPYKLNTSLLSNENYTNMMRCHILAVQEEEIYKDEYPHLKWELLKSEIRSVSQHYSRFLQSNKHCQTVYLRDRLNDLEKKLAYNPSNSHYQQEIAKAKKEI
ncbi:hypothetical protein ElyMa_001754000 [Elysia marginata]|uniref:Endonuclease/exonuclease/phosphatase domain-containing protein n=1 Tax=Elysia marginata TaxID=1093978 RepID=A0AAV4EAF7_9GAST|nr:hypothetical protein ElyMa_001754000 [Elysia marginata]